MLRTNRNRLCLTAAFILLLLALVAAGGCGGSGGGNKLYVMGAMHGDLAEELNELCDISAYDGVSADAPLIVSYKDGSVIDDETAKTIRKFLDAGQSVALEHADAVRINEALKAADVVPDFRYPNVIRLAPSPLYTSFAEVWELVRRLKEIMDTKAYEKYSDKAGTVA